MRRGILALVSVLALSAVFAWAPGVSAQFSSTNYKVEETFIGSGGELEQCAGTLCSKQTAGELANGRTSSATYSSQAGFTTSDEELLSVIVDGGAFDFGDLSTTETKTVTTTFSVKNYLSTGYVVRILGNSLKYTSGSSEDELYPLPTPTASAIGTEQFGINLANNATPDIGAEPAQSPDTSFSYGEAANGYDNPDQFKFVPGDIIAESASSSGQTTYTMSMIANITSSTAGGVYSSSLLISVIPTF